jgi:hypothetical protein
VTEAFLPSTSPSGFGRNDYYPSDADTEFFTEPKAVVMQV